MDAKRLGTRMPTLVAVAFTAAMLVGTFVWFTSSTDEMLRTSTAYHLEMNAKAQAAAFNTKLSGQVELLRTAANYWEDADGAARSAEETRLALKGLRHLGSYTGVAVAGADGRLIDGSGIGADVSEEKWFRAAMDGRTEISGVLYDRLIGEHIAVTIPLKGGGSVVGAMRGTFPASVLSSLIETVGFQEECSSILLSEDGTILARSASSELVTSRIANFYDMGTSWGDRGQLTLDDVKLDLIGGRTATIPYRTGSRERLAILTPVGLNDWYYAVVLPKEAMDRQARTLSANLLVVMGAISLAFFLLLVSIMHLLQHNRMIEDTNDRFRMVTTQTQAVVFDYDFTRRHLELNGNVKFIDDDARDSYTGDEIGRKLAQLVHADDRAVLDELSALRGSAKTSLLREARIRCADGGYYWHRITGAVVRDAEGRALRLVGNIVNVEDEISKEQLLKQKAEVDSLSGLLNKGAFTQHVSETLDDSTDENLYAFYIIDLDNFKKVNDTLGHIVGDRVISDVAQKLCTVFSENDIVGRIGGDEFAAFLKLSGPGRQLGRRIIEGKAEAARSIISEAYTDGRREVRITASIGVSVFPRDGRAFNDLYRSADGALYLSKDGGKDRWNITEA